MILYRKNYLKSSCFKKAENSLKPTYFNRLNSHILNMLYIMGLLYIMNYLLSDLNRYVKYLNLSALSRLQLEFLLVSCRAKPSFRRAAKAKCPSPNRPSNPLPTSTREVSIFFLDLNRLFS